MVELAEEDNLQYLRDRKSSIKQAAIEIDTLAIPLTL